MPRRALAFALALSLVPACATEDKHLADYLKHQQQPLSADEVARLKAREARVGDTIDRVSAAWFGVEMEQTSGDRRFAIFNVRVPYGTDHIRVGPALETGQPAERVGENGLVILTFEHNRLASYQVLAKGVR